MQTPFEEPLIDYNFSTKSLENNTTTNGFPFEICCVNEARDTVTDIFNLLRNLLDSEFLLLLPDFLKLFLVLRLNLPLYVPEGDLAAAGADPGVDHMMPVLVSVLGQNPPPLHDEHTGITNVTVSPVILLELEARGEGVLVFAAVCKP